jgi:hypothetical protein
MTIDRRDDDDRSRADDERELRDGERPTEGDAPSSFGTLFERAPPGVSVEDVEATLATVRAGGTE